MVGLGLLSLVCRWRGTLYRSRFLHVAAVAMSPAGFIAVLAGWITAEVGRQPYTVYGALRTSDSISPVDAAAVGASLIAFLFIYTAVFGAGTFYILRLMLKRPELHEPELPSDEPLRAAGIMPGPARESPRSTSEPVMSIDLAFIWAGIIAFAVLAYVMLDGFDLGIGILFPFFPDRADRDRMMNSIAPVWDGNETWLVLGGGGLLAAFPLAYAIVMPALYAPIIGMVLALVFRGVAFEFRWKTERGRRLWDWAFAGGSIIATLAQGMALGALVQGIPVIGRAYAGGWWDWLSPFSLLTGLALLAGYALLGATWLILKTDGGIQLRAYRLAATTGVATASLSLR